MSKPIEKLYSVHTRIGLTAHAYTIAHRPRREDDEAIRNLLCSTIEKEGWSYLPIILETRLSTGGSVVREVLSQNKDAATKADNALNGTEKYYHAIFVLSTNSGDNAKLMKLH